MKISNSLITIIFSTILLNGTAWAENPLAPEKIPGTILVGAEETIELIVTTPNLLVFDSRKEIEYQKGHIQGSFNFLDSEMTLEQLSKYAPDKSTPLLFYCNGERCQRSSRSAIKAQGWGYKRVYWFRGGWKEWVEKGMPVSR